MQEFEHGGRFRRLNRNTEGCERTAFRELKPKPATFMLAPFFGIGGFLLGKGNLESLWKKIVKLNMVSAGIISLITGTLLISASLVGLPQSLVKLNSFTLTAFTKN
jgi:phosphate/sulfate permease